MNGNLTIDFNKNRFYGYSSLCPKKYKPPFPENTGHINVLSQSNMSLAHVQAFYGVFPTQKTDSQTSQISPQLQDEMESAIRNIYGKDKEETVFKNVIKMAEKAIKERNPKLKSEDLNRPEDWFKKEVIYMFYPEQFGVMQKESTNQFKDLPKMFKYLNNLGVTTLYITPFFASPMGDGGFDIKNFKDVRQDLGGLTQFDEFLKQAQNAGFKIQADLVLNHVSNQHEWFQKALSGDKKYLDYFIHTDKKPCFTRCNDEQKGIMIDYVENNIHTKRRLMFPTASENHYQESLIKGKKKYFYHTFYPFQPDLNWKNPELMYEVLDVCSFWANKGIDIFRLDAIPFYIKEKGTTGENLKKTHEIVKLLSSFLQATAPRSVLQAEACMWPKEIRPYFGEDRIVKIAPNRSINRTNKIQMAYNFPYMPSLWASVLTGDSSHFWNAYEQTPEIPNSASWSVFSRCHDELTLEMIDVKTRKLIYDKLISKGAKFREGLGVSGRLANFLNHDTKKINLMNSITFSLPGIPVIYYGDEIGVQNNWDYAKECAKKRQILNEKSSIFLNHEGQNIVNSEFFDSREINRGPICQDEFYNVAKDKKNPQHNIFENIKKLIHAKKSNSAMNNGKLIKVNSDNKNVLAFTKKNSTQEILVLNNLSDKSSIIKIDLSNETAKNIKNKKVLMDLISQKEKEIIIKINDYKNILQIELQPYESTWLETSCINTKINFLHNIKKSIK